MAIVALTAGALTAATARRWPQHDPGAPKVDARRPDARRTVRSHPRLEALLQERFDPGALTGLALTVAVALLVGAIVAVGLLLAMAQHDAGLARFDMSFARWGSDNASAWSTSVLRQLSQLGGTVGVIAVALVVAAVELRRQRKWAVIGFLTLAVGGQFAAAELIKAWVDRARPDIHQLTGFSGSSFPSGHATAAAATYAAVALLLGRRRSRAVQTRLVGLAVAIAVTVAGTRVLLGVHWFTDVIAGLALGWAWFALCSIAFGGRLLRFGEPVASAEEVAASDPGLAAPTRS